jgi:polyisoprenyl-phosphate glycosyltransferase
MLTQKKISVVVTCYRDEGSIHELLRRVNLTMAKITPNWEVIYVNDASPDNSEAVLLEAVKTEPRLTVISHSRNFGAQVAFTTGMRQASGDAVVIMDGDLQDPPELIEDFVTLWLRGHEVVYGIRAKRQEGPVRNLGYKSFYKIFKKIAYISIPLDAGEFSLMDRVVVDAVLACPESDRLIRGLRAYAGFRQIGVTFERPKRYWGETTQSLLNYVMWAYKSFTSYSLVPLRIINFLSFGMFILFGLLLIIYLGAFLAGAQTPHGYMTILCLILLVAAVITGSLAIIGEYIARIFLEVKQRPQPIISTLVNDQRPVPRSWLGRIGPPPPPDEPPK